jgi:acyl carrier protein
MQNDDIRNALKDFIVRNSVQPLDPATLTDDFDLIESGALDSFLILEVSGFMEDHYKIVVAPEEIVADNFLTLGRMVSLVQRLAGTAKA